MVNLYIHKVEGTKHTVPAIYNTLYIIAITKSYRKGNQNEESSKQVVQAIIIFQKVPYNKVIILLLNTQKLLPWIKLMMRQIRKESRGIPSIRVKFDNLTI